MLLKRAIALLLLAVSAWGAGPAQKPVVTQAQLDKWLAKYQRKLLLQDWRFAAAFVSSDKFEVNNGRVGEEQTFPMLRTGLIKVLAPEEYKRTRPNWSDKRIRRDIEFTIVHELYHFRVGELVQSSKEDLSNNAELLVDRLTQITLGRQ